MARPPKELPLRSSIVPAILRHATALGLDVEALSLRFALPPDAARSEEATTAPDTADEMMHAVARAVSEPDVSLRVAAELRGRRQTLVALVVRSSADVRQGLERLARCAPLLHEGLDASLVGGVRDGDGVAEGEARWILRAPRRPSGARRYVHEVAMAHALSAVRAAAGDVAVARAWFVHPRPPQLAPLYAFLATRDLSFGCEDSGFAVPAASLRLASAHADPRTVEAIAPLVEAELEGRRAAASFADRVAAHVASLLPAAADVVDVARAMHMSPRTLQRRLEQEQTRFTEVLDRARLGEARRLLADPATKLADVAFRVGFADLATFSRAFKRWTGLPPGQWRRS
jgi:AraC-like DNA-binding protein